MEGRGEQACLGAPKWNHSSISAGGLAPDYTPPLQTPVSCYMELIVILGSGMGSAGLDFEVSIF